LAVITSIFLLTIGDVMVLEKSNIHNPIRGYDTFETSKLRFFFHRIRPNLTAHKKIKNAKKKFI
jgi:hypothetical protein